MRSHHPISDEEASNASWEAVRGATSGALKWGAGMAALAGVGYMFSPLYRSLTVQFKVYIQMSGMVLGGMIDADARLRQYERRMRMEKRLMRENAMRANFEKLYGKDEDDED
ncbi:hypothetical protein VTK73DRAFT_9042 [Phialemonium thermophilum]|uniref:Imidazoleglycerol-phosphate dehydratase n=1 Tax=Phialemonium thermophilum TaxID=223376 RepID=A0ABR3XMR2_9PEZI